MSPTASTAPRITRSNSIPTHDSTFELYSTSQMGSTLSLADKSKGMIRSGSFRDPVDDGESAVALPSWRGLLGGSRAARMPFLLVLLHGLVHPVLGIGAGDSSAKGPGGLLCWHLPWATAHPVWVPGVPGLAPGMQGPGREGGRAPRLSQRVQLEGAPCALLHAVCPGGVTSPVLRNGQC